MKAVTWFNNSRKLHEATLVTRGRPIYAHATESDRANSKRTIATGSSSEEAVKNLEVAVGGTVEVVSDSKVVTKQKPLKPQKDLAVA